MWNDENDPRIFTNRLTQPRFARRVISFGCTQKKRFPTSVILSANFL